MATPKEIFTAAIEFAGPERVPVDHWTSEGYFCDHHPIGPRYEFEPTRWVEGNRQFWDDSYGNTWSRLASDELSRGEVYQGVLNDWRSLDNYEVPPLVVDHGMEHLPAEIEANQDKFITGCLPGLGFSLMRKMRRMDNFLMDVALEKDRVNVLHRRVMDTIIELVEAFGRIGGFDGVMFAEDWGTQDRLLISPHTWREMFKPYYRELCECAHGYGIKVLIHSCGYLYEILDDMIEVGIDVFQFDQQLNYGLDALQGKLAGRAALFSPVDIQHVLVTGDARRIREHANALVERFGQGGGFIAKSYNNARSLETIGCKVEWNDFGFNSFMDASDKVYGGSLPRVKCDFGKER